MRAKGDAAPLEVAVERAHVPRERRALEFQAEVAEAHREQLLVAEPCQTMFARARAPRVTARVAGLSDGGRTTVGMETGLGRPGAARLHTVERPKDSSRAGRGEIVANGPVRVAAMPGWRSQGG